MVENYSPFVYWSQDKAHIYLNVELRNLEDSNIQILNREVNFEGLGEGSRGKNLYKFHVDLFGDVDIDESSYNITDRNVDIKLVKLPQDSPSGDVSPTSGDAWWPRLMSGRNRPTWLRLDFDRWRDPPGYEDSEVPNGDVLQQMENFIYMDEEREKDAAERLVNQLMNEDQREGFTVPQFRTMYLIVYNTLLSLGFISIFVELIVGFIREGTDYFPKVWETVGQKWLYLQAAQWFEVLHVLARFVPGNFTAPLMQNFSRTLVLALIWGEPKLQDKPFVFYLFVVWAGIEIVRYPYYLSACVDKENSLLTWLRYSMWIPLYPTGITIEGIIILRAALFMQESGQNAWTLFGFIPVTLPVILGAYLLFGLLPGGFFLINLMRKQRRKKLGPARLPPAKASPRKKVK